MFKFDKYASSFLKESTPKNTTRKDDEDDESNYFLTEFSDIEKNIRALKELDLDKSTEAKNSEVKFDDTAAISKKKKELEAKLKSEQLKKEKKQKALEEISELSATLQREEAERVKLDEDYKKKLYTAQETREASRTALNRAEARLKELEIKKIKIANLFHELKQAEKVDICFMLDATGSMDSYIAEAKTVIHRITDSLRKRFQDFQLRVAYVGYRDHSDGADRVTVLDFSENKDKFKTFVSSVEAKGGDDQCEDIFGGLEVSKERVML